ncbi:MULTISPECIES: DUF2894 domain-containing protein [Spongiibacter]|uniref:DUF2894 domain-containing protein n=1 Tax=Spongiibacter TaxID=630749 RepID=UPI0023569A93|nr:MULTISPECIES: DUF2894 domain-containing protein [Spongiibacter]
MSQSSLMPLPALKETLAVLQADYPHVDPPRLHGIAQLLARAEQQRPAVQAILLRRAAGMLENYQRGCQQGGGESRLATIVSARRQQLTQRRCGAAVALRALQHELNRETGTPAETRESVSPISALLRQQEFSLLGEVAETGAHQANSANPPRELRALRLLRSRQRHQDIEQRIDQAIQNAPEDPGPLNPQMLAIRALTNMRERSPAYLKQFVGYLDTLMWLEAQSATDDSGKAKARKQSRRK